MIIEEGTVIILDDSNRYLLVHEIGEIEGYPNKNYYFAAGVTKNDKINTDDICFIEIEKEGQDIYATKVRKNTELYDILATVESISIATDADPSLKGKITEELEKLEERM